MGSLLAKRAAPSPVYRRKLPCYSWTDPYSYYGTSQELPPILGWWAYHRRRSVEPPASRSIDPVVCC